MNTNYEGQRLSRFARSATALLLGAALSCVLLLLLLAFPALTFDRKRTAYTSLWPMAASGVCIAMALAFAARGLMQTLFRRGRLRAPAIAAGCAALFCLQAVLWYFSYFIAGWDLVSTLKSAYAIAGGDELIDNYYLSLYPNNALLTLFFGGVMKLFRLVTGGARLDRCVYALILVQCAVNSATAYVTTRVAQVGMKSDQAAVAVFFTYAAFTGISPWMIVPYSDCMGLIVPVSVLRLYQMNAERERAWIWPAIGLLTFIGWSIKPQAVIATIAVLMLEGARLLDIKKGFTWIKRALCVLLIALVGIGPTTQWILDASPIELREGKSIGGLHYVMMGLNPESNGVYRDEDMILSASAPDPASRSAAQMEKIKERVAAMDGRDWAKHLAKKAMSNFADAPVIWSEGGVTCWQAIENKDNTISPALKALLGVENGRMMSPLFVYFEGVWLALLAFALVACATSGRAIAGGRQQDWIFAAMLAVFGLMLFQMIFEAGNRYFMIYTPFVVLLAVYGLRASMRRISEIRRGRA